jgi:hypothetical protein
MKTIYLHVGYHKTGTTSIQVALYRNREKLKELGFLYPVECCPTFAVHGQHVLPWLFTTKTNYIPSLRGKKFVENSDKELYINKLKSEIENSGCQNIIISSEEFDMLTQVELADFNSHFQEYNIIPVVMVRNLPKLLTSLYQTSVVHSSYTKSFIEFVGNQRSRLDIDQFIADLCSVFKTKVKVFNFDSQSIGKNIVTSFISMLDSELIEKVVIPENQNLSLPLYSLEVLKLFRTKQIPEQYTNKFLTTIMNNDKNKEYTLFNEVEFNKYQDIYQSLFNVISQNKQVELHGFDLGFEPKKYLGKQVDNLIQCIVAIAENAKVKD